MEVYSKEDYSKSYTEVIEILKHVSHKDLIKIPTERIEIYIKNRDINYKFSYDENLEFEKQNIMQLTKAILANIYIKYWATDERRKEIEQQFREEEYLLEKRKQEKYSIEKIFEARKKKQGNNLNETAIVVIEKRSIFVRIIEKVRRMLKLT